LTSRSRNGTTEAGGHGCRRAADVANGWSCERVCPSSAVRRANLSSCECGAHDGVVFQAYCVGPTIYGPICATRKESRPGLAVSSSIFFLNPWFFHPVNQPRKCEPPSPRSHGGRAAADAAISLSLDSRRRRRAPLILGRGPPQTPRYADPPPSSGQLEPGRSQGPGGGEQGE
jgi:hypothetical protein